MFKTSSQTWPYNSPLIHQGAKILGGYMEKTLASFLASFSDVTAKQNTVPTAYFSRDVHHNQTNGLLPVPTATAQWQVQPSRSDPAGLEAFALCKERPSRARRPEWLQIQAAHISSKRWNKCLSAAKLILMGTKVNREAQSQLWLSPAYSLEAWK